MLPLETRLQYLILSQGPITISQFISLCLDGGKAGYYHQMQPFGAKGDFITAPEVSQMFGEMLGIWAISAWQQSGCPKEFVFCEMGPGRGTLMDDMIRTINKLVPDFFAQAQIILVETSRKLRLTIAEKLKPHDVEIKFVDHLDALPRHPWIIIGNELLDCLPIHQYVRGPLGWHERMVALDEAGHLCFALSPQLMDKALLPFHAMHANEGEVIETSPVREGLMSQISQHIATIGGAALFIDYGSLTSGFGDTLQALSRHQFQDPLASPGQHDLTSHVDFAALVVRAQATGCIATTTTQAMFLEALGIKQRAAQLCTGRDEAFQQQIARDLERLTAADMMGNLFKALIIEQNAI